MFFLAQKYDPKLQTLAQNIFLGKNMAQKCLKRPRSAENSLKEENIATTWLFGVSMALDKKMFQFLSIFFRLVEQVEILIRDDTLNCAPIYK